MVFPAVFNVSQHVGENLSFYAKLEKYLRKYLELPLAENTSSKICSASIFTCMGQLILCKNFMVRLDGQLLVNEEASELGLLCSL